MTKKAYLALEDGSVYKGISFGYESSCKGEVVFNTSFCGYQEILTDPSYSGQIVVMTTSHIGNYGVNLEDFESDKPYLEGFIALRFSDVYSSYRAKRSLKDFLADNKIVAACNMDTRVITKKLRTRGSMNGILTTNQDSVEKLVDQVKKIPGMVGNELASKVSGFRSSKVSNGNTKVCLVDCGFKENIKRSFEKRGISVDVISLKELKTLDVSKYDAFCISNGPGDPVPVEDTKALVKKLAEQKKPLLGICLGHQIIGNALGAKITKLRFGHHGGNHPVQDLDSSKVYITSQNHGFCVDEKSAVASGFKIKFKNLYDGSIEGLVHKYLPFYSVQFHPEAAPGPQETGFIFDEFVSNYIKNRQ
ncbi:MAG: glutamine-hydrolyzing carbamoyl-phosphate synthase small subunit [Planctomycetes bacterium]|nr:glutamine-hydrolyzing carbamoyl-phosphate synthase small subunit [Planctomycetota bacterium]